jgi:hypothetical protein
MGKKSLRRSRGTKQSSAKQSKSHDSSQDEKYESLLEQIVDTTGKHILLFPSRNEGLGQLLTRLMRFWGEKESGRRGLVSNGACLCNAFGIQANIDFMQGFVHKVVNHLNAGEFELARLWMLTFYVLVYDTTVTTEAEWISALKRMIDYVKNNNKQLQCKTANTDLEGREMSPIETCYYYSKSVCRITQWVLCARFEVGEHHFCGYRVVINILYYTDSGSKVNSIFVNTTIKLRTLLLRLQGELKIDLGSHNVILQDKRGFGKGSLIMKYSGNKTLEHIGFENNDVLQIVNASAMDIASKPNSRMPKKKEKQSSSVVSSKENTSKSLSRSTVKPRISGSKKQSHQNQPSYCSDTDQDRVKHSKFLTLVFEEATELFQTRRQRLNKLSLKKCKPKQKNAILKPKTSASEPGSHCCLPDTGRKAGKTVFPVLVGHQDYLYKSSKYTRHLQSTPYTIDLHGCTKEDAVNKLDSSLPFWIDEATKELPGTVGVNIIAGGGNQIVAEAVEHWICEKRNVGKRFT